VINGHSVSSFGNIVSNLGHFLERVRELSPTNPDQPIMIPGDLEREFEEVAKKKGILIPVALVEELNKIATELGVGLISDSKEANPL
jgi:LDH2 family malate/lactate/ureidoglycolate dehydrogenase